MFSFFVSSSALKKLVGAGKTFLAFMVILGQAAGLDGHVLSVGLEKIPTPPRTPIVMAVHHDHDDGAGGFMRAELSGANHGR
jgi:hypothetical protein